MRMNNGRGAERMDLRERKRESERGKENGVGRSRSLSEVGTRWAARGHSTDGRRNTGRQRDFTPRGGGRGQGRHREGVDWGMTKESKGRDNPKYDARNKSPQTGGGGANPTGRERSGKGPGLGYKKLEDLSKEDPAIVAISLSNHPALKEVLGQSKMKNDLVELLCLLLSNAFSSRADRANRQHLADIVKGSDFFRVVLPYYLTGMESEPSCSRRAQYPEHLGNILTILSEVFTPIVFKFTSSFYSFRFRKKDSYLWNLQNLIALTLTCDSYL